LLHFGDIINLSNVFFQKQTMYFPKEEEEEEETQKCGGPSKKKKKNRTMLTVVVLDDEQFGGYSIVLSIWECGGFVCATQPT